MAEHVQQLGWSQESGETNLHEDWTSLAPSITDLLKEDHLKAAIESLDTDINAVTLSLTENLENYFEPENQTNSLRKVSDVVDGNEVLGCKDMSKIGKESNADQNSDTDELNLSYNANSCSQVSLDAENDAQIHKATYVLATCVEQNSENIAFQPKDQEFEANSLQKNLTEISAINSIESDKPQYKYDSDALSQAGQLKDTELCHSLACSGIIHEKMKNTDDASHAGTAQKQNSAETRPNTTEECTHSEASVKYKPQFGNKKHKLSLSAEASENQCKVTTTQTNSVECKTPPTNLILVSETSSIKQALVENGSTANADETTAADDNTVNHFSSESISDKTVEVATSHKNNKDSSVTKESTSTTGGNEVLPNNNKTEQCSKTVRNKGKRSKCESSTIGNESVPKKSKNGKTTSELISRKGKNSTTSNCKSAVQKAKPSKEGQKSTTAPNASQEKEESSSGIKCFLEQQEKLAHARNLLRSEKQKNESKCTEMFIGKLGLEDTSEDETENTYEEKVKVLDSEVSLLETLIEQVKSLTEGEEDHEKCLSLLGNIREKASASLLLKYPVLVAVLEPIQRYDGDERIKQEAENIYKQLNSMYIKINMEDFVFAFDKTLKLHHRHLSRSERLAQRILKRILPSDESSTDATFDIEMWTNLAKERSSVWERFVQEFQEQDKTTVDQAASGSSSPTSNIKEEVEEMNIDFNSTDLDTMVQEQQETRKLMQPSRDRTNRKASHSSFMSKPRRAQTIVKPEHGIDDDVDVKPDPDELITSKRLSVRIKEEIIIKTETLNTEKEIQRKQPTRSCKTPKIKEEVVSIDEPIIRVLEEVVSSDEPIIRVKQEFDSEAETVNRKKEMQQRPMLRSSKTIKIKEVIPADEQIVRIKEEIDSDTDIQNTNREFPRIQPPRPCKPNKGKLELKMHFAKRKSNFNKGKNDMSKKAKVSSG